MALIETLLDLPVPNTIRISPNSQHILYSTTLLTRTGEHDLSTLWLANTGHTGSARKLTSGESNDHSPRWSSDGKSILFVSDRAKPGEQWAIYSLDIEAGSGPRALTPTSNEQKIDKFEISPDGTTIAYLSAENTTSDEKASEKDKDDAKVWGQDWRTHRLRLLRLDRETNQTTTLGRSDAHFTEFAWNDDGSEIALLEVRDPDFESPYQHGTSLKIFDPVNYAIRKICTFPTKLASLQWAGDKLYAIGALNPDTVLGDNAVYSLDVTVTSPSWIMCAHGGSDSSFALGKAGRDITVKIQHRLDDQIRMLNGPIIFSSKRKEISAWDAAFTTDSDELIIALAQSSVQSPPEVYTTTASGGAMIRLSSHAAPLNGRTFGNPEFLNCTSADGTVELDALWVTPASHPTSDSKPTKPLPTVLYIHGGPYHRVTNSFDPTYHRWAPLLLDAGYALLFPNYRGSSGRGHNFAAHARGGVGTVDYADVMTLTNHAVELGYADPARLLVSGWSQGGCLTYLSCVRNGRHGHGWRFKAAIAGAGVMDWDGMVLASDVGGTFERELAGQAPWESGKGDVGNRRGSAIWEVKEAVDEDGVIPPILILHGEKDERVPVSQAVGFRRALESQGLPFEMVVYPREEHKIKERRHVVDMSQRVVKFVKEHLGKADVKT